MIKHLIGKVSPELFAVYERAKWTAEESVPNSLANQGTSNYCPPVLAVFSTSLGTIYGFNEDTIFYYDESDGVDKIGGCWEYDQLHDCNELSIEGIAKYLNVKVAYVIKNPPKSADVKDIAMSLVYLSKGFQEDLTQWELIKENVGMGEDDIFFELYSHAKGIENVWILCSEKGYKKSGMWLFEVVEALGVEFAKLGRLPTPEEGIKSLLERIYHWMDIPYPEMQMCQRQFACAYKTAF